MILSCYSVQRIHLLILALVVSALVPSSSCLPLQGKARKIGTSRDGLIMGKDFLSLFMGSTSEDNSSSSEASIEVKDETTASELQKLETTTIPLETTTISSTVIPITEQQEKVTEPPSKIISIRVSSTSSVSEATPVKTTTPTDIFTTFLDAFSKNSKDVNLVTDNDPQITPSSIQRSDLSIEEATPSTGPITRSIPSYGSKIISNRYRPRTSIFSRPRPRPQYSSPQSASEPIEVRLSPTATYSVVRYGRNQVRPQVLSQPPAAFTIPPQAYQAPPQINYEIQPVVKQSEPRSLNFQTPEQQYGQPEKIYGQPERNYAEPEKNYGKPEKVYGEPEKVYGEPEKVYSQPEQIYGTQERRYGTPVQSYVQPEQNYAQPEQNYEVAENVNVESKGRVHGVQTPSSSAAPAEGLQVFDKDLDAQRAAAANQKFGYVVEGRNYRKYRVEERTPDGFIVGEYGVVNHNDGQLRGVRYTADGTINPKLIYEALMKFLAL